MASFVASRSQASPLCAVQRRGSLQTRRSVIVRADAESRRGAMSRLAAVTLGIFGAQSVRAEPAPVYNLAGLFDKDNTGGKVGKSDQQKDADKRQKFLADKKPSAPEFQAGLGSQGTERQDLGPKKLIRQQ